MEETGDNTVPSMSFQVEAHRSFTQMREAIYLEAIRNLLLSELVKRKKMVHSMLNFP